MVPAVSVTTTTEGNPEHIGRPWLLLGDYSGSSQGPMTITDRVEFTTSGFIPVLKLNTMAVENKPTRYVHPVRKRVAWGLPKARPDFSSNVWRGLDSLSENSRRNRGDRYSVIKRRSLT